jgi:predicted O-methyltransferase YrrM
VHFRRVAPRGRVLARLVAAVRAFNRRVHGDARVDRRLVPIGNAMTLARKRSETTRNL